MRGVSTEKWYPIQGFRGFFLDKNNRVAERVSHPDKKKGYMYKILDSEDGSVWVYGHGRYELKPATVLRQYTDLKIVPLNYIRKVSGEGRHKLTAERVLYLSMRHFPTMRIAPTQGPDGLFHTTPDQIAHGMLCCEDCGYPQPLENRYCKECGEILINRHYGTNN